MNLLNRLTLKNLKLNKKRTIVTIVGIILSVALITAVTAMFFSAKASLINYETSKKGNYHYAFKNVLEDDIKYFKENRNFESIYIIKGLGYANLLESKNFYKPYIYIEGFDKVALENSINLIEGRLPENSQEIIIPTHLKTNGRVFYKIGDTLELEVGDRVVKEDKSILAQDNSFTKETPEEIINAERKTYKIVGIMERPASTIESYSAPGYTFATLLDEEDIKGEVDIYTRYTKKALKEDYKLTANILGVDEDAFYYIHYDFEKEWDELEYKKQLEKLGEPKYVYNINSYLIQLETGLIKDSSSQALGIIVLIVVAIIIFTSVFCIKNSFNISITEKTKQYGMLSTVGATSKQIKKNVYTEALMLGLIGIPLGIICGLLASFILILVSNLLISEMLGMELIWKFSFLSIIFAIVLGLVTLYLSAWGSARRASKITPITAIRNSEDIKIDLKKIKSPKYIKKIFGIGWDISYKNLKRNKKKYRATILSIIVCSSVFIALASFINLAFNEVKREFKTSDYNISLSYRPDKNTNIHKKAREVVNFDNVEDYSIVASKYIEKENKDLPFSDEYLDYYKDIDKPHEVTNEFNEKVLSYSYTNINVYRLGDYAYKKYIKNLGLKYEDIKDKGILINAAEIYVPNKKGRMELKKIPQFKYEEGDILKWSYRFTTTDKDNKLIEKNINIEIPIAKITEKLPFGVSNDNNESLLFVSDEFFASLFSEDYLESYETIYIDSNNASKLQDEIEEHLNEDDYSLINIEESVKMMRSFYTLIAIFLYGFIIVIALIGITNIFNTITTNMELRSREFATLKSVGMTRKEFNKMISLESFFYGTKSLLIGIPIGCLLSFLIYKVLTGDQNNPLKYELPLLAIVISIVAVFILITCIMKFSIKKISKQNTIETIRNENI